MARTKRSLPPTNLLDADQVVARFHAAGLTDLNVKWVKNQTDRGALPCVVVARRRRFRQDLIEQIIQDWCDQAA